jgi:predicted DNA-binding transcriptional regulator YafY
MARNTALIRQWEILRAIDGARNGIGIGKLAAERGVCQRTIRRDLEALCRAGFPLYDDKVTGTSMWKLGARPFGRLEETGLSITEMSALYFSRTMFDALTGTPLSGDAERAFMKIEKALPIASRKFLDQLPRTLKAKADGRKKQHERTLRDILARTLDATLLHRRATMRYASASSKRTKDYTIEPQRIVYAHGGIYLMAWVLEYEQIRTFAAERIETFGLMDETFEPRPLPAEPFADSLGVNTGTPERIVIEIEPDAAPFVREREWHKSQVIQERGDGGLTLTLSVCNDWPLRAWILGLGPDALVRSPTSLAQDIFEAVDRTRRRYVRTAAPREPRPEMLAMKAG